MELELAIARGTLVTRDKQLPTRGPPLECTLSLPSPNHPVSVAHILNGRYQSMGMALRIYDLKSDWQIHFHHDYRY